MYEKAKMMNSQLKSTATKTVRPLITIKTVINIPEKTKLNLHYIKSSPRSPKL